MNSDYQRRVGEFVMNNDFSGRVGDFVVVMDE